jgi:glycolate oxidase iron-sulfur subunit
MDRCLGCRACEPVCPSGVEYGHLLERARSVAADARPPGLLTRGLLAAIAGPVLFRVWMGGSRLLRASGLPRVLAALLPPGGSLRSLRLGMAMLDASAPTRLTRLGVTPPETTPRGGMPQPPPSLPPYRGRVGLLSGCVQDHLFRRVNGATRRVLEANGWEVVEVPGQGCCGALHAHAGALDPAREMARTNVHAFQAAGVDRVVVNAAGCGAALRAYSELFEDGSAEKEAAHALAARVRDISELVAGEGAEPRPGGASLSLRVAFDPPCHLLHAQRVEDPPRRMLQAIPGLELLPLRDADRCCGGAGIYGLTHPELGGRIGEDKADAILDTGCEVVATGNPGCAMQIGGVLRLAGHRIPVVHPVELLDESYRRGGLYDAPGGETATGSDSARHPGAPIRGPGPPDGGSSPGHEPPRERGTP